MSDPFSEMLYKISANLGRDYLLNHTIISDAGENWLKVSFYAKQRPELPPKQYVVIVHYASTHVDVLGPYDDLEEATVRASTYLSATVAELRTP